MDKNKVLTLRTGAGLAAWIAGFAAGGYFSYSVLTMTVYQVTTAADIISLAAAITWAGLLSANCGFVAMGIYDILTAKHGNANVLPFHNTNAA